MRCWRYSSVSRGEMMGSRSFNAWPQVEAFLDSIPDGRNAWRHKTLPMSVTIAEREGQPVVGRAWKSKSLFINEAISHYIRKDQDGVSCSDLRLNIEALQKIITEQGEEIQKLKEASVWQRIFG